MKRLFPFLVALILAVAAGGVYAYGLIRERYSYSQEREDWAALYGLPPGERVVLLEQTWLEGRAYEEEGEVYLPLSMVREFLDEIYYASEAEGVLLYSTATDTYMARPGEKAVESGAGREELSYAPLLAREDGWYVALEYLGRYKHLSVQIHKHHVYLRRSSEVRKAMTAKKATQLRVKGGIKSPILEDVAQGDALVVLESMEKWSKVQSASGMIGYVENGFLEGETQLEVALTPPALSVPEYTGRPLGDVVRMGWHAVAGASGNDTLEAMLEETAGGINVIAPTWFSLMNEAGELRSFASAAYVQRAKQRGVAVWAVVDDFNYNNEHKAGIDVGKTLSSSASRQRLIGRLISESAAAGVDGVNVDFERVDPHVGQDYVQFLRELSIACRQAGLTLSVDNYVPFHFNNHYRIDIQGQIGDYVVIMGYDEHWSGSQDPGSVASLPYVSAGLDKSLEKVEAAKVVNALPLYTIVWTTQGDKVSDEYLTVNNTQAFLAKVSAQPQWDGQMGQNTLFWQVGDKEYQVWLEDGQSIAAKLEAMAFRKIGGVAAWRIGYGTKEIWQQIGAYGQP